jgi:hypothetical protein
MKAVGRKANSFFFGKNSYFNAVIQELIIVRIEEHFQELKMILFYLLYFRKIN